MQFLSSSYSIVSDEDPSVHDQNGYASLLKSAVDALGGDIHGVLQFSIMWNDDSLDHNDLDAHCKQPNGVELYFSHKEDKTTSGKLDVDIITPKDGKAAVENITLTNRKRIPTGTYEFFVHQCTYRDGDSGFQAEIEFDGQCYCYNYPQKLCQDEEGRVAYVTFQNNQFS